MRAAVIKEVDQVDVITVDDPVTWAQSWSGEYPWVAGAANERLYEYACHEGNYALGDILRGARLLEAEAAQENSIVDVPQKR